VSAFSIRSSFWLKLGVGLVLIAVADALFFQRTPGATLGAFALLWLTAAGLFRGGWRRDRRGLAAAVAALVFALIMIDRPGFLAWCLFGLALLVAVLSARVARAEDAWRWTQRLVVLAVVSLFGPILDLVRLNRINRRRRAINIPGVVQLLVLPLLGGAVFLGLFASANPLIGDLLARLSLPPLTDQTILRVLFWLVVLIAVGGTLRPRWRRKLIALPSFKAKSTGVTTASVILSLILFNLLFAVQNGLDLAFLWSGAPLPDGVTLAEYAHRGAYPLIATALLAGLFVLVFLRPGTETAAKPMVRRLVVLWVAQNLMLVASSLLRTADYIEVYSLTRFRIAAMIWMALVGVGLGLICWRLIRNRSANWLINANVAATLAVLAVVSVVDLGAIAAAWNARHAQEVDHRGARLDLCYLSSLNGASLVSLVELEQRTTNPELKDRIAAVRADQMAKIEAKQSDWRGWRWRDARRLDRVEALTRNTPLSPRMPGERDCEGRLVALPAPIPGPSMSPIPAPVLAPSDISPLTSQAGA